MRRVSRRAGSMKCCLFCLLLLTGVDTFRIRVESLRQSSLGHSTQQTRRHVPSRVAFGKNTDSSRRRRRGARTAVDVSPMAVGPGMESDSRIRGDPAALERWLSGGGGIIGPVVLEETPRNGWGLRAERDIEAGESVAVVPRSLCLGLEQTAAEGESEARKDNAWIGPPCVQALVEQVPEEFADVRLGLVLLHERFKTGSAWETYIQNLPSTFTGAPLSSFGAVEMRALQDRDLAAQIDKRCIFLVSFVKDVLDPLEVGPGAPFGFERVTFAELAWATAAVSSRAFTNLYGGWRQEEKPLLVPFLDMVNFNLEESNVKVVSAWPSDGEEAEEGDERPDRPEVRLVTTRSVPAGESLEIREPYSNAERLCKYGFVDLKKKNECNTFTFEKKVLKAARIVAGILDEPFGARFEADALEPWQQRVLIDLRLDGPGADLKVHLGGDSTRGRLPVDDRLLAALRVMFSRSKQELEGKTAKQLGKYKTGKLSVHVEQRVLATVLGLSLIYVQQWPTTLEQDEVSLYGRRVTPTLEQALASPPPWQALAKEDETLQDVLIERLVAEERARSQADGEDKIEQDAEEGTGGGEEEEKEEGGGKEGKGEEGHNDEDEDGSRGEYAGGDEEGDGGEGDDDKANDESARAEEEGEGEEGEGEGEGGTEEEEAAEPLLAVNPELTWEMVQAIGYRLAKKRAIMDVGLLARAELRKTGLAEGMMDNARPSVGPLSEWISERSVVRPKKIFDDPAEDV